MTTFFPPEFPFPSFWLFPFPSAAPYIDVSGMDNSLTRLPTHIAFLASVSLALLSVAVYHVEGQGRLTLPFFPPALEVLFDEVLFKEALFEEVLFEEVLFEAPLTPTVVELPVMC